MANGITIINPLEFPSWDNFVQATGKASFFHSLAWATVLSETYRYTPQYFCLLKNEQLQAMIPLVEVKSWVTGRRAISLPFSDSCAIISRNEDDIHRLLGAVIEHGRKNGWKYFELRPGEKLKNDLPISSSYLGHTLALNHDDEERLLRSFRESTQRNIKKALKAGVECSVFQSLTAVKQFYALNCKTRKRHGIPPQPFAFFEKIYQHIISKGGGIVVLASQNGQVIAGSVCFGFGRMALYKYGASDYSYQHLRANYLVMQEAIRWYSQRDYDWFDMGRTDLSHKGLNQFKAGWNTSVNEMAYYKYDMKKESFIMKPITSQQPALSERIFNRLPETMLRLIGTLAYRHVA